jgi:hypothetical protein
LSTAIKNYLDDIKSNLRLDNCQKNEIIGELHAHIEDEVTEFKQEGFHDEEAISKSLDLLGSAKYLARQIYEAHSQGTWKQALIASLPHILFGLVFILNIWQGTQAALILLVIVSSTAVYGWWKSHSDYLFSWLGYSFLPVIAAGLSLLYLPTEFGWVAILLYLPLSFWLFIRLMTQTIKKDWIFMSLMLLPLPLISAWFILSGFTGNPADINYDRLIDYSKIIGPGFLILAVGVISFVRIRCRILKIGVLFVTGIISVTLFLIYARGHIEFITLLLLIIFLLCIFLIPAVLDNGVRTGKWGKIFNRHLLFK